MQLNLAKQTPLTLRTLRTLAAAKLDAVGARRPSPLDNHNVGKIAATLAVETLPALQT